MLRALLVKFSARPTRTSFVGLGTALVLGVTAMAAVTPVITPAEEPRVGTAAPATRSAATSAAAAPAPARPGEPASPAASASPVEPAVPHATVEDGHFGGVHVAAALAAAGYDVVGGATEEHLLAAAGDLEVPVSDEAMTVPEVEAIAAASWETARHQFTLAGINPGDAPDPSDIREAAERFGVNVGRTVHPSDVVAVLEAGREDVAEAMEQAGFDFGPDVDVAELQQAAEKLDVEYGKTMEAADAKVVVWKARDVVKRRWEAKNETPAFAKAAGVVLRLPSHRVEYAGFHQAAFPGVISMKKAGKAKTSILPSRNRATSRASAIDIVQAPGEDVRAPVSGKVVEVTRYSLYGKYADVRMRIVPNDNRRTVVTVLHVEGPKVKVGDKVKAGMTVIADGPRKFPFRSQIDRFAGRDWGHVHVEIRSR